MAKLSAKFLLGTSTVIEKVGFLSYFLFLARIADRIHLKFISFYDNCLIIEVGELSE